MPWVTYKSPSSASSSVAFISSAGPISPTIIPKRHTSETSHPPFSSSTKYSGKKKIINNALFGHNGNDVDKLDEVAENYVNQIINFNKEQDEANRHVYEEHLKKQ